MTAVVMPQMGLEVTEGTVATVHVVVGATVVTGEALVEVETDKALTDVPAPCDGTVIEVPVSVGDTVPVGAPLLHLGEPGDAVEPPAAAGAAQVVEAPAPAAPADATPAPAQEGTQAARLRAAPVARRAAARLGVALESLSGSGPRGRIVLADVEAAAATGSSPPALRLAPSAATEPGDGEVRLEPLSATRHAIARRMTASQAIPQFTLDRDLDATWLLAEKARLSADGPARIGVNDLLVAALAQVVLAHPALARSYVEPDAGGRPQMRVRSGVGVGVGLAVATDRGLVVPVITQADTRSLGEIAVERDRLVGAARAGRLQPDEMRGAVITVSSLAGFGVDRFDAMVNPGEAAILAVGRTVDRVVPQGRGLAVVPAMTLSLTVDHRVLDGGDGALALSTLATLLEGEATWRA